jgi:chorismate mutase/prephenate dehydratase
VLSHPQGLLQCQEFLHSAPWLRTQAEFDTAGAARQVRERNDPAVSAIAGDSAARVFGLAVLRRGIQSQEGNYTRFVELAREPIRFSPEIPAKTSLLLITRHEPGALAEVLGVFSRRGVNLAKLESRPIPGSPFKYRFYLDLDGNADRDPVRGALAEVQPLVAELRVLGTYPAANQSPSPLGEGLG